MEKPPNAVFEERILKAASGGSCLAHVFERFFLAVDNAAFALVD